MAETSQDAWMDERQPKLVEASLCAWIGEVETRRGIAEPQTGPIVDTGLGELAQLLLNSQPHIRGLTCHATRKGDLNHSIYISLAAPVAFRPA